MTFLGTENKRQKGIKEREKCPRKKEIYLDRGEDKVIKNGGNNKHENLN